MHMSDAGGCACARTPSSRCSCLRCSCAPRRRRLAEELAAKGLPQQLLMPVRHGEMVVMGQGGVLLNTPKLLPVLQK
jgi:hypothetical protein